MGVDFQWSRVEIVFQGLRASAALKAYIQCQSARQMVKSFVNFPQWRKWNSIMGSVATKVIVPPKETETRAWLLQSVSKSIAKEMAMEDSHEFWLNLVQRIREEYMQLTKEDIEVKF